MTDLTAPAPARGGAHTGAMTPRPPLSPQTVWEKSDRLLAGGMIAVRGVGVPHAGRTHGAVAVTVLVPAGSYQVVESDGAMTATLLVGPGEALGVSAWLREAAQAADAVGPPLYDWASEE